MAVHYLKIDDQYLEALLSGAKTFEIRKNDRNYKVGDILIMRDKYQFYVTYTSHFMQIDGYLVMSVKPVRDYPLPPVPDDTGDDDRVCYSAE